MAMEEGSRAAAAGQRRHLAMLERLSRRQAPSAAAAAGNSSSAAEFLSRFADARRDIESTLYHLRTLPSGDSSLTTGLAAASSAISDLDRLLAESSHLLPPYDLRSALSSVADLRAGVDSLLPKKRFSFRNKNAHKAAESSDDSAKVDLAKPAVEERCSNAAASNGQPNEMQIVGSERAANLHGVAGFWNQKDATLVKSFVSSDCGEGDFTLAELEDCRVYIKGKIRTLFIHKLRCCKVFVGPVLGSVLIEDAKDCVFAIASHQIRIHESSGTDFYLRVRSRPIIEDCNRVRFAPYVLLYDGVEEDLRQSDLSEETGNWATVDDFKWLRAVPSPNWCLIPEGERMGLVDISEIKELVDR